MTSNALPASVGKAFFVDLKQWRENDSRRWVQSQKVG
jgi:hypothetical protein